MFTPFKNQNIKKYKNKRGLLTPSKNLVYVPVNTIPVSAKA